MPPIARVESPSLCACSASENQAAPVSKAPVRSGRPVSGCVRRAKMNTSNGARWAQTRFFSFTSARARSRVSWSSLKMNSHGCALDAEGAQRAASKSERTLSSGISRVDSARRDQRSTKIWSTGASGERCDPMAAWSLGELLRRRRQRRVGHIPGDQAHLPLLLEHAGPVGLGASQRLGQELEVSPLLYELNPAPDLEDPVAPEGAAAVRFDGGLQVGALVDLLDDEVLLLLPAIDVDRQLLHHRLPRDRDIADGERPVRAGPGAERGRMGVNDGGDARVGLEDLGVASGSALRLAEIRLSVEPSHRHLELAVVPGARIRGGHVDALARDALVDLEGLAGREGPRLPENARHLEGVPLDLLDEGGQRGGQLGLTRLTGLTGLSGFGVGHESLLCVPRLTWARCGRRSDPARQRRRRSATAIGASDVPARLGGQLLARQLQRARIDPGP